MCSSEVKHEARWRGASPDAAGARMITVPECVGLARAHSACIVVALGYRPLGR